MPLIIIFREPSVEMVVKGKLDGATVRKLTRKFKSAFSGELVHNESKVLIVGDINSNIVYIREIDMDEYRERVKKQKEMEEQKQGKTKRIDTPKMVIKHPFNTKGSSGN